MANNKGAVIFLAIIAVGALGLSGYMFIEDQFLGGNDYVPDHEHEFEDKSYKLVGLWDSMGGSGSSYNLTFGANKIAANEYVNLTDPATFNLTQEGWYKFTIVTIFTGLDPTNYYYVRCVHNGTNSELVGYVDDPSATADYVNMVYYVHSSVGDLINFLCGSSLGDSFSVSGNNFYNHAILEYGVSV